jgi:predicted AlkP superfamily phosphohydrolase/phosphomutase
MKRIILISLDGVNWPIVNPMIEKGLLPNLKALISEGNSSTLQTHSFISSGSTWPSIHTGRHPGDHGILFSHRQMKSGTYHVVKKQPSDIPFKTFWQKTAEAGVKTIAFDLPKAPLISKFDGLVLNSWGEESPWYSPCFPLNLKKQVQKKFGKHPLQEFYHRPMKTMEGWISLRDKLIDATQTRMKILRWLMEEEKDWQLVVMAVNELHLGGHLFWHLIDPASADFDKEISEHVGDVLEKMMEIFDQALGSMINDFKGASFLIISNNGMGPSNQPVQVLDVLLKKMGYMYGSIPDENELNRSSHNFVQEMEAVLPLGLVQGVKKLIPRKVWNKWGRRLTHSAKDWKKSIAFPLPNDVSGAIRINLKGREPNGIVTSDEYDQVCDSIIEDFNDLKILESGKPAVARIIKVQEEFKGERVNELADLLVLWNVETRIEGLTSEKIGKVYVKKDKRSGSHTDKGIFIWQDPSKDKIVDTKEIVNDLEIHPAILKYFELNDHHKVGNIENLLTN